MHADSNNVDSQTPLKYLVRLIVALALTNVVLIVSGAIFRRSSAAGVIEMLGVIAPVSIQFGYWLLWRSAFWANVPHGPRVWRLSSWFGIAAGFVFCSEILLEYIILPGYSTECTDGMDRVWNCVCPFCYFGVLFVTNDRIAPERIARRRCDRHDLISNLAYYFMARYIRILGNCSSEERLSCGGRL